VLRPWSRRVRSEGNLTAVRFIQFADVHLGKTQYGLQERSEDFARAYAEAIKYCLERQPDFILLAGDLFEQKAVDPETFSLASTGLKRLRDAGIPVFAIEGNHEKFLRQRGRTWIWYLSQLGLLKLLDVFGSGNEVELRTWDESRRHGSYFDLEGIRIFGVGYYGARLPQILEGFTESARAIDSTGIDYSICMLHTGVDDKVDYNHSGASAADIYRLRGLIDYVAVGHIHHQFAIPDGDEDVPWIFSSGAFENWSAGEVGRLKGLYEVTIDPTMPGGHDARHRDVTGRRAYFRLTVDAGKCQEPADLQALVANTVREEIPRDSERPIVELRVSGVLRFERSLFDAAEIERIIRDERDPLVARVVLEAQPRRLVDAASPALRKTRAEIEKDVLNEILGSVEAFPGFEEPLAEIASALKERALQGEDPESLLDWLDGRLEKAGLAQSADS